MRGYKQSAWPIDTFEKQLYRDVLRFGSRIRLHSPQKLFIMNLKAINSSHF